MKLIAAADKNWSIGKDGGLLCHMPGDLKFFKEKTLGIPDPGAVSVSLWFQAFCLSVDK